MLDPIIALWQLSIVRALVIAIILTAIICLFVNMLIMPFFYKKFLEEAEREGRMIIARHKKTITPSNVEDNFWWGIFEYEYNGKKYKYRDRYYPKVPLTEVLYFRKSPSKAKRSDSFGRIETEWRYIFGVCFIISWLASVI